MSKERGELIAFGSYRSSTEGTRSARTQPHWDMRLTLHDPAQLPKEQSRSNTMNHPAGIMFHSAWIRFKEWCCSWNEVAIECSVEHSCSARSVHICISTYAQPIYMSANYNICIQTHVMCWMVTICVIPHKRHENPRTTEVAGMVHNGSNLRDSSCPCFQ